VRKKGGERSGATHGGREKRGGKIQPFKTCKHPLEEKKTKERTLEKKGRGATTAYA